MFSPKRKILPETFVDTPPPSHAPESAAEDKVHAIAATLKKLYCEQYVHGKRVVFGRNEVVDGEYLENHCPFYSYPVWKVHNKARDTHKDLNERYHVPDEKVRWDQEFKEYNPDFATEADQSLALIKLQEKRRAAAGIHAPDLRSFVVKHSKRRLESSRFLELQESAVELRHTTVRPEDKERNPYGRTGLKGKGVLLNWGANFACDPVITRVDPSPAARTQVLVCLSAANPGVWCLPGGTIKSSSPNDAAANGKYDEVKLPNQRQIPELLATILSHNVPKKDEVSSVSYNGQAPLEFLSNIVNDGLSRKFDAAVFESICSAFRDVFERSKLVYRGYCDDPRNTDDAWMETFVHHYHLPENLGRYLNISNEVSHWRPAGSQLELDFQWIEVGLSAFTNLFPSHFDFVELCVPFCKCGRRRFDHTDNSHRNTEVRTLTLSQSLSECDAEWKPKESSGGSDAGDVQFIGKSTNSHYARARMDTEEDVLNVRLLLDAWGMKQPQVLISLTGGAQTFSMDQKAIEDVFQGILQAATVTNACICDGGTDTGVMKLIGEAVARDGHRVDLIGVATWGVIISRECMLQVAANGGERSDGPRKRKPSNQFPTRRRGSVMLQLENLIEDFRAHTKSTYYLKTQPNSATGAGLDPNHRYFVLVDDGSVGRFGSEIAARAHLEQTIRDPMSFAAFKKVWELAQRVLHQWDPKEEGDPVEFPDLPTPDVIALRTYLHTYHLNHIKAVQAVRILDNELQERLDQPDISNSEKESIRQVMKVWQHLRRIIAGNQAEELLEELADDQLWSKDDLELLHKYLLKSHKMYETSDKFRDALEQFDATVAGRRRSTVAPLASPAVRSPIPKKFTNLANETRRTSSGEDELIDADKDVSADMSNFGSSWRSGTLKKQLSGIKSIQKSLVACAPMHEEHEYEEPSLEGKVVSTMVVPHCFRCEGTFRDRITLKRWKNSIPQNEYDEWRLVQRAFKEKLDDAEILVRCEGCKSKLYYEEVEKETFHRCKKCSHYFFGSRALYLRHKGRPHINCDGCGTRRKLDELLGSIVPGVLIVVQGGPGTIETVALANRAAAPDPADGAQDFPTMEQSSKHCTPIVVVEGSGKAADLIAFTWRHLHEGQPQCYGCARSSCVGSVRRYDAKTSLLLPATCPLVRQEYQRIFWTTSDADEQRERERLQLTDKKLLADHDTRSRQGRDNMTKHVSWVIEVCRRKESVTIFNAGKGDVSLVYAIMRAICKGTLRDGQPFSTVEQLKLAIDWDLAEDELTAVMLAKREVLNDDSWDVGETASDLRESLTTAMVYALKRNSWRFVELLDHAGAILPNRELVLKSLYPREVDLSSNDNVIPNRLRLIMNLPKVRLATKRHLWENYRDGVLSDEDTDADDVFQSVPIERSHAWQHVMDHVLMLKDPVGRAFHVEHYSRVNGFVTCRVATTAEELKQIREEETGEFRERARLVMSFEEFDRAVDAKFNQEIFGTKAHVDAVMRHMGWLRPPLPMGVVASSSNEQAYSELFVWAMLMGRTQLAKLFWRRSPSTSHAHCISRALFASAVARRMAAIAGGHARKLLIGDRGDSGAHARGGGHDTKNFAAQFESLAKRLMRTCFQVDQQSAGHATLLPWDETGDCWADCQGRTPESLSPFTLAGYAKAERFVDDPAFQACVDSVWYGNLILDDEQGQAKLADEDYILLPFVGKHMGELGLRQKWFLALASGGAAIPAFVFMAFYGTWEVCVALLVASYSLLPICMVFLSGHYRRGRQPAGVLPLWRRIFWRSGQDALLGNFWWRLSRTCVIFYTAPIIKFLGRWIHFILFVLLYTYVGVTMVQDQYSSPEAVMHGWLILLFIAEIRQLLESGMHRYVESVWNALDLVFFTLYSLAGLARVAKLYDFALIDSGGNSVQFRDLGCYNQVNDSFEELGHEVAARYKYQFQDMLEARGLHGVVGIFLWVRLLDMLRVDQDLGPLVLVMRDMLLHDVLRFTLVLFIFVLGFGVAFICAARPYPDAAWKCNGGRFLGSTYDNFTACSSECSAECYNQLWRYLSSSISYTYFQIHGEHWLTWAYFSSNREDPMKADDNRVLGPTLLAIYLMISAIVLLNLLIAMMNTTYSKVQTRNLQKWRYQKMELVLEHVSEPWTPPPFNFIVDPWIIMGKPDPPKWLERLAAWCGAGALSGGAGSGDTKRWEVAKGAMERVRKLILKQLDAHAAAHPSGTGWIGLDIDLDDDD